ncbi:MAG TPA: hypothetical protein EYN06_02070 [Myxococcales bacterium]|nr:hypothetical protein [Myxococcales bacterium]
MHRSALLGPNAPPERIDRLTKRLALPAAASGADEIIFAGGPNNKTAFVAVGVCTDNTPEDGQCRGDDWVSGDMDWLDQVETDKSAAMVVKIADLETRAPGWLWSRKPTIEQLKLLPGYDESAPKVKSMVITTQLHGDNPGATLEFETLDEAAAGILQSRIDLWRAERARQQEQDERDLASAKDQMQMISLIAESLALSTQQWDLATKDARADVLKHQVQKRQKALEARLSKHKTLLSRQLNATLEEAHNILDKVGPDGLKTWQSEVKKGGIKLNIEVLDPKGVDQLVRIFN